jgi:Flp pilus assembly protein TadB
MPEKPAKPSLRAIYRQQRAQDREAEQSGLAHRILSLLTPAIFLIAAIGGAKHWIPASVSLIVLAACIVGLAVLVVWSRRRRNNSASNTGAT